jgi:hypothetical protein
MEQLFIRSQNDIYLYDFVIYTFIMSALFVLFILSWTGQVQVDPPVCDYGEWMRDYYILLWKGQVQVDPPVCDYGEWMSDYYILSWTGQVQVDPPVCDYDEWMRDYYILSWKCQVQVDPPVCDYGEWMSDYYLAPSEKNFSYIMARTCYISMFCIKPTWLSWLFGVLAHWNNSLQVEISLHSNTLSW